MFYLFREHHLLPGEFYRLPRGEQLVLRAFFEIIMEERSKKNFGKGN